MRKKNPDLLMVLDISFSFSFKKYSSGIPDLPEVQVLYNHIIGITGSHDMVRLFQNHNTT